MNSDLWECAYSPATNLCNWSLVQTVGSVPIPRARHSATVLKIDSGEDVMVVFGGITTGSDTATAEMWMYDVSKHAWSIPPIDNNLAPPARWGHTASAMGTDRLLVTGGFTDRAVLDDVWVFSLAQREWMRIEPVKSPDQLQRGAHSSVFFSGHLIAYGGTSLDLKNIEDDDVAYLKPGCNKGFQSSDFALNFCKPCPSGSFAKDTGATVCTKCPAETTTASENSTSELDCNLCQHGICKGRPCSVNISSNVHNGAVQEFNVSCQCGLFYSQSSRCELVDWWWIVTISVLWLVLSTGGGSPCSTCASVNILPICGHFVIIAYPRQCVCFLAVPP